VVTTELQQPTGRKDQAQDEPPCKTRKGETDVVDFLVDSDKAEDTAVPTDALMAKLAHQVVCAELEAC